MPLPLRVPAGCAAARAGTAAEAVAWTQRMVAVWH